MDAALAAFYADPPLQPQQQEAPRKATMPSHPPPPPPVAASQASAQNHPAGDDSAPSLSVSLPSAPSAPAPHAAPSDLSPKTSKLLRRIRKREQEIEELSYENNLLKEANRKSNETLAVLQAERRAEEKRWQEKEAAWEQRINELRQELERVKQSSIDPQTGEAHDPTACAQQVDDLRSLLSLREEQLELIQLDRLKLYQEIESWRVGMERLAQLHGAAGTMSRQNSQEAVAAEIRRVTSAVGLNTCDGVTPCLDGVQMQRSCSDSKEDAIQDALSPAQPNPMQLAQSPSAVSTTDASLSGGGSLTVSTASPADSSPALVTDHTTPPSSTASTSISEASSGKLSTSPVIEEIYQNESRHSFFGWQPSRYPFRPALSDESGNQIKRFEEVKLPDGWVWDGPWRIDRGQSQDDESSPSHTVTDTGEVSAGSATRENEESSQSQPKKVSSLDAKLAALRNSIGLGSKPSTDSTAASASTSSNAAASNDAVETDADGWRYSLQWRLFTWHPSPGVLDTVRRRRWIRRRVWVGKEATESMKAHALKIFQQAREREAAAAAATTKSTAVTESVTSAEDDGKEKSAEEPTEPNATTHEENVDNEEADSMTLESLAAAYSSSGPGDSFSMFTSVAPLEVRMSLGESQSQAANGHGPKTTTEPDSHFADSPGMRAFAALLQLASGAKGAQETDAHVQSTSAATDGTSTSANHSKSANAAAPEPSTNVPTESSSDASLSSAATMIANLSSLLSSTRLTSWVGRRSSGNATTSPPHAAALSSPAMSSISPASSIATAGSSHADSAVCLSSTSPPLMSAAHAPSPVCSLCDHRSKVALQFVSPTSGHVQPLISCCRPHYRDLLIFLHRELDSSNPLPVASKEKRDKEGTRSRPTVCQFCEEVETFPVLLLHLAQPGQTTADATESQVASETADDKRKPAPSPDDTTTASGPSVPSSSSPDSIDPMSTPSSPPAPLLLRADDILDSHDAFRFCVRHMDTFLQLLKTYTPGADIDLPPTMTSTNTDADSPNHTTTGSGGSANTDTEAEAEATVDASPSASHNGNDDGDNDSSRASVHVDADAVAVERSS